MTILTRVHRWITGPAGRLHRGLTGLAVRPHLPARTIRLRLTVVYGGLFLLSAALLLAITYVFVWNATAGQFVYRGPDGSLTGIATSAPHGAAPHGAGSPGLQVTSSGSRSRSAALSPVQAQAQAHQMQALAASQHASEMHQFLVGSGIALAIMAMLSIALGWMVAGRTLRPLRAITDAARNISATNLQQRLSLSGPDDELKKLGDTVDDLLGRLEAAFDAQRRFVANASHELRTPLTVGRALLQMALTDPDATVESLRSACEDAIAAGDHQERLIGALLMLARSERGLDHREPLDLSAVTGDSLVVPCLEAARVGLGVTAVTEPAPTEGDPRLAERLVTNLLDNALRHNIPGGAVEVTTGTRAGRAFLAVANTGPVVPPDEVGRLLQPFQRLGDDSTRHGDGLGLGLSIVQAIATAHDAILSARARPGGGLEVEVTFPAPGTRTGQRTPAPLARAAHAG
jgi:signal transduction histidine kinase